MSIITEADRRLEQRFEAQEKAISDALRAGEAMRQQLELRQEQRFQAQEKAVEVALDGVNREFHEHLVQYQAETKAAQHAAEMAVAAALASTEKAIDKQERATEMAITKQEVATEKRFEGVNEFRAQQADIISTFARKAEVEARLTAITEKMDTAISQISENLTAQERRTSDSFNSLGSRLDIIRGNTEGTRNQKTETRAQLSSANMILGLIIAVITIIGFIVTTNVVTSGGN